MIFFLFSVLAGVLTILAPCIFPLLPVIIGSGGVGTKRKVSRRAVNVILALSFSVIIFTLLLKATTLLITIPDTFWKWFSGGIIAFLGLVTLFPSLWAKIPFISKLSLAGNRGIADGYQRKSFWGDILIGFSLGPVFTTCSPTYFFILATVLPATPTVGLFYLFGFSLGLAISLFLVAYLGQYLINKLGGVSDPRGLFKKFFGLIFLLLGIAIITGYDKELETKLLDSGVGGTIDFENRFLEKFN